MEATTVHELPGLQGRGCLLPSGALYLLRCRSGLCVPHPFGNLVWETCMESAVGSSGNLWDPAQSSWLAWSQPAPQGVVPKQPRGGRCRHMMEVQTQDSLLSPLSSLKQALTDVSCSHCRPSCPDPQSCEYLPHLVPRTNTFFQLRQLRPVSPARQLRSLPLAPKAKPGSLRDRAALPPSAPAQALPEWPGQGRTASP